MFLPLKTMTYTFSVQIYLLLTSKYRTSWFDPSPQFHRSTRNLSLPIRIGSLRLRLLLTVAPTFLLLRSNTYTSYPNKSSITAITTSMHMRRPYFRMEISPTLKSLTFHFLYTRNKFRSESSPTL